MKRFGGLWPQMTSFDNLFFAWRKARKGKARKPAINAFALNLERELLQLQRELISGDYQPGQYRLFTIYERKPRQIAAAPFRDRVVHHALMNVVEPLLDRRFIDHSYACRKGRGVHKAVDLYQRWSRRYAYVLKMDVLKYFPSIDHERLQDKIARHIKDPDVLSLFARIIETAPPFDEVIPRFPGDDLLTCLERRCGIPIGNLTSQFLANLYLNDFDHYMQGTLKIHAYLRYVDDIVVLGDNKSELAEIREQARAYLIKQRLHLHPRKAHIFPVANGVDILGYRVFPHRTLLRNDNGHRFQRKLRRLARGYAEGRWDWGDFNPGVQSWIGHAGHADTWVLRAAIFSDIIFRRGVGDETSCVAGRCLEQQTEQGAFGEP